MPRGRVGAPRDPKTGRFLAAGAPIKGQTPSEFARDLYEAAENVPPRLRGIIDRSCGKVVDMAKANVRRTAPVHNAGAYKTIDHEIRKHGTEFVGVVGYNRRIDKSAHLGNLLEFGNGGDRSPAHWDLARALEAEQEPFLDKVADMAEAILESRWGPLEEK